MSRRPEFQWETPRYRARRLPVRPDGAWHGDSRAEAFELVEADGSVAGTCTLGIHRQAVSRGVTLDPGLELAVSAWLVARGQRTRRVFDDRGIEVAAGAIDVAGLGVDRLGREPARLCTLSPSNAEFVHALGEFGRVVACESSSDYPPAIAEVERLGPDLAPDLDRIVALQPDLVVSSLTVPGMERVVTGLATRGVAQVVLAPRSLQDVVDDARRLGRRLGVMQAAARVADDFSREQARLAAAARCHRPVRVYLEWWPKPMFSPGRDCYSNELIALAGGRNVFGDRPGSSLEVRASEVVAARPDVCFVSWCGVPRSKLDPERLRTRPGLEALATVHRGHVAAVDEAYAGRPGPRCLEAARLMATAIQRRRAVMS
ncbi:MAG: hypothetical protein B7733_21265 [Myxococcales bacterium FL481]|nr:MAG: hypothetical protein B7733_21265 [Myxococcales bacterium FL481]